MWRSACDWKLQISLDANKIDDEMEQMCWLLRLESTKVPKMLPGAPKRLPKYVKTVRILYPPRLDEMRGYELRMDLNPNWTIGWLQYSFEASKIL
jgi:hypothetical protein